MTAPHPFRSILGLGANAIRENSATPAVLPGSGKMTIITVRFLTEASNEPTASDRTDPAPNTSAREKPSMSLASCACGASYRTGCAASAETCRDTRWAPARCEDCQAALRSDDRYRRRKNCTGRFIRGNKGPGRCDAHRSFERDGFAWVDRRTRSSYCRSRLQLRATRNFHPTRSPHWRQECAHNFAGWIYDGAQRRRERL